MLLIYFISLFLNTLHSLLRVMKPAALKAQRCSSYRCWGCAGPYMVAQLTAPPTLIHSPNLTRNRPPIASPIWIVLEKRDVGGPVGCVLNHRRHLCAQAKKAHQHVGVMGLAGFRQACTSHAGCQAALAGVNACWTQSTCTVSFCRKHCTDLIMLFGSR